MRRRSISSRAFSINTSDGASEKDSSETRASKVPERSTVRINTVPGRLHPLSGRKMEAGFAEKPDEGAVAEERSAEPEDLRLAKFPSEGRDFPSDRIDRD